ncbi:ATP-binding cassette domain-containing protein [Promicromonospora sp. NPDC057488]|uniref:ATP-binding cassette domain-containing protein n=1 Tax=Promicromonospora sp. NPDC057488 TaxID=3346147 RepID=UPI00366AC6DA
MGENGSGKSSLLQAVAGILPYRGTIEVDGIAVLPRNSSRLAGLVGYAPQSIRWPREMTVADVVKLAARLRAVPRDTVRSEVDRCLGMTGIEDLRAQRVARLSGGQHRRLTVAQALVHRPRVLVLDEPTAEADPVFSDDFATLVRELEGTAVVASTNSVEDAVRWGGTIHRLHDGGIVRVRLDDGGGPHADMAALRRELGVRA